MTARLMTAREACARAGVDRDRLNEYVAAGRCSFVPPTRRGRARLFDPDDVAALAFFSDIRIAGVNIIQASAYTGWIREALGTNAKTFSIRLAFDAGALSVDLDALRARA